MTALVRLNGDLHELAHDVLDGMIDDMKRPEFRVQFAASMITVVFCARSGMRFLPSLLVSMATGSAAAWVYRTGEEIAEHIAHLEIEAPGYPQLNFHGIFGCLGHDPDKPFPADCPDAPGEI